MPSSWESIAVVVSLVIPGFLFLQTAWLPSERFTHADSADLLLKSILLSLIHHALFGRLLIAFPEWPAWQWLRWHVLLLVTPVVSGLVFRHLLRRRSRPGEWLYRLVGWGTYHALPTSWDFCLSKGEARFVLLTLNDGSRVGGIFASNSFASAFPHPRDLFLEEAWEVEGGRLVRPVPGSGGVWLPMDQVKTMEFFRLRGEEGGESRGQEEGRQGAAEEAKAGGRPVGSADRAGLPADGAEAGEAAAS